MGCSGAIVNSGPLTEGLWLPPGPAGGGGDAGRVLGDGPALVRGGHRALHLPRQQPEAGVGVLGPRGAAALPGHPGAARHRPAHLPADGLLRVHDPRAQGEGGRVRGEGGATVVWCAVCRLVEGPLRGGSGAKVEPLWCGVLCADWSRVP